MKFILLSNDKANFKIKQKWDFTLPETIVDNSYCYDGIKHLVSSINYYAPTRSVNFSNILNLEIRKNKEVTIMMFHLGSYTCKGKVNILKLLVLM